MNRPFKHLTRRLGIEITRFNPLVSESTRLHRLLDCLDVDVVLDVGANKGQYGRRLRDGGYRGTIVSFEPQVEAHTLLLRAAQGDPNWLVGPRAALGPEEGNAELFCSENSVSSSLLQMLDLHTRMAPRSRVDTVETVPVHRLDRMAAPYLSGKRSIFLKLDVQGYERQVLDGATALLSSLSGLQIELSLAPLFRGQCLMPEMVLQLRDSGFALFGLIQCFTDVRTGRQLQVDGLFARADLLEHEA